MSNLANFGLQNRQLNTGDGSSTGVCARTGVAPSIAIIGKLCVHLAEGEVEYLRSENLLEEVFRRAHGQSAVYNQEILVLICRLRTLP